VLIIAFNILSRNIFDYSSEKIFEAAPVIMLWLALSGSSLALKKRRHIKLDLFLRYCPEVGRRFANCAISISGMIISGLLFHSSIMFVMDEIEIFGNKGILSAVFPVFFALSFFRHFTWMVYRRHEK
jgi:TRAP-type C4-dicarboxylate transport system permease small subunit